MNNIPNDLAILVGTNVVVVADEIKGYGKKTKFVGQKGVIIGWRPWKYGYLPVIKLESGEEVSNRYIWWSKQS